MKQKVPFMKTVVVELKKTKLSFYREWFLRQTDYPNDKLPDETEVKMKMRLIIIHDLLVYIRHKAPKLMIIIEHIRLT